MIYPLVQTGNTGGGGTGWTASVANYAALPTASADNNELIYFVEASTGFLWNKRKGLYQSNGTTWNRLSNVTLQSRDDETIFVDDGDTAKKMDFQLSNITTGNTRTITMADRAVDLAKLYPQQTRLVAKTGGDYATIQAAYDSIADATSTKRYTVLVAPGRYNEQLTPVEYVTTVGLGQDEDCEVYYDGKVVDITTQLETSWHNMYFNCPATSDNLDVIEIDAGSHEFFHCKFEWQTTTDAIRGRLLDVNGGSFELEHCEGRYTATGTGAAALHTFIDIDGSVEYEIQDCNFEGSIASSSGGRVIEDASTTTGSAFIRNTKFEINCTNATFSSSMFLIHVEGVNVAREFQGNVFHIHNTGGGAAGTGTVLWQNGSGSGVLNSINNDYKITGMGSNRPLQNDASDVINICGGCMNSTNMNISGTVNWGSKVIDDHWLGGNLVLPKTAGFGIKLEPDSETFGWRDMLGKIQLHGVGANEPVYSVYRDGIRAFEFNTVADECYIELHIPHDYAPGTDLFIHAHWSHHAAATWTTGALTWDFEMTYAKGHDQANFPATVTPTVTHDNTADSVSQYRHIISEVQCSAGSPSGTQLDSDDIEVDGLILIRVELSANTSPDNPFLHFVDIHYQSTNIATKQKAPNFYV